MIQFIKGGLSKSVQNMLLYCSPERVLCRNSGHTLHSCSENKPGIKIPIDKNNFSGEATSTDYFVRM